MTRAGVRRVVVLGFMAAGKTTVGRLLAERLGWEHVDLDREIEREQGRTVAEIFADAGEAWFRGREAETAARLLERDRLVLTPGGGWVTVPGALESLPPGTLSVWLQVSPEEVIRRVRADAGAPERPLLRGPDPLSAARRLLDAREPLYRQALLHIHTDGRAPSEVADQLDTLVRERQRGAL